MRTCWCWSLHFSSFSPFDPLLVYASHLCRDMYWPTVKEAKNTPSNKYFVQFSNFWFNENCMPNRTKIVCFPTSLLFTLLQGYLKNFCQNGQLILLLDAMSRMSLICLYRRQQLECEKWIYNFNPSVFRDDNHFYDHSNILCCSAFKIWNCFATVFRMLR